MSVVKNIREEMGFNYNYDEGLTGLIITRVVHWWSLK
jgi:hypothetical protein